MKRTYTKWDVDIPSLTYEYQVNFLYTKFNLYQVSMNTKYYYQVRPPQKMNKYQVQIRYTEFSNYIPSSYTEYQVHWRYTKFYYQVLLPS